MNGSMPQSKGIHTANEIVSYCDVSLSAAENAASNIANRLEKYGYYLFDHEKPLIQFLEPDLLDIYSEELG